MNEIFTNHETRHVAKPMLAECVGFVREPVLKLIFSFCGWAIIQSFYVVENFFKKDLVCKVIVFTFALQF